MAATAVGEGRRLDAVGARAAGRAAGAALAGREPPALLVQTAYSLGRGTVSPELWGEALAGLRAVAGPCRALLCDRGDLAALPACIRSWGREGVGVAARVDLWRADGSGATPAALVAPDAAAYARLCEFLSWRQEDAPGWEAWQGGVLAAAPSLAGVTALVTDAGWAERLAAAGAAPRWWTGLRPSSAPAGLDPVAAPLLTDIDGEGRRLRRLLAALQARTAPRPAEPDSASLTELPALAADPARAGQVAAGRRLAASCRHLPGAPDAAGNPPLLMPPGGGPDPEGRLRRECEAGLLRRYGPEPPRAARGRLARELAVIGRKGFAGYVLVVWDLARGRRTCGRGSAASSLVCYCLGLTNVDPLRHGLVFERFLSDERVDPPDIDVDFPWDERDRVIAAAIATHGRERVAMVATHLRLHDRGAFRQAARARGWSRERIGAAQRARLLRERFDRANGSDPDPAELAAVEADAALLVGLPRYVGLHCGGVVITREPIRRLVPVHPAAKRIDGRPVPAIAWEKDGAEAMGLVKMDLLGNRALAVIRDCLVDLAREGLAVDPVRWRPETDPLTLDLVGRGETIGCFYIESPAMRLLNAKAGGVDFERLVVHSSIIRPAANRWIETYLERLHEYRRTGRPREEWYPHPVLRRLLSESFGILSYQEDVMLVARELAGFDAGGQNALRKCLGKPDSPQRLAAWRDAFYAGCAEHGATRAVADLVWGMISSFAGYSFCKAHSASYAMVSFQCAWLKAHFPAVFLARVIEHGGGFYDRAAYVEEARRCGVRILPPCVVRGAADTRPADASALRLGLRLVRGVSRGTVERILRARTAEPFRGARDLVLRARPSRAELRNLLWAGALDHLLHRFAPGQRSWLAARAVGGDGSRPDRAGTATGAEAGTPVPGDPRADPAPPPAPEIPRCRLDRRAWEALDCLPRAHPFDLWELPPRRLRCRDLLAAPAGRGLTVLAWCIARKQVLARRPRRERSGEGEAGREPMAFVTLEDETAVVESVWFPDSYRRCGAVLEDRRPFFVRGAIERRFDVPVFTVSAAWPLRTRGA